MRPGRVFIIGAGPGAPDLITVRGLQLLRSADLVIQDGLLPYDFLERAGVATHGRQIEILDLTDGRRTQDSINEMMLSAAREGRTVARLKVGDPFIFGRGAEEAEFLALRDVPVEVVPGITSATAAPTNAWLPVTERGQSHSFAVVTARREGGVVNDCFPRADNLVVLMGVSALEEVAQALMAGGWPAQTPAAVIERATMPWERRAHGTLGQIALTAHSAGMSAPAVLLAGPGAARRLTGARPRPLILFTGLDPTHFRVLGDLLHWPALRVVADEAGLRHVPDVLEDLRTGTFDTVVFTSRVGVDSFCGALEGAGLDARVLAGTRIVVAGAGTASRLWEFGVRADAVPRRNGSEGIIEVIGHPRRVLLVQGSHAPVGLTRLLGECGAEVRRLALHRVERHPDLGKQLPDCDVVYYVSPSGVGAFHDVYGEDAFRKEIWCIGEMTRGRLSDLGFEAKVVNPHED